ncbi:hypothetical protein HAX54_007477 [Datura stramonium]|uniref:Uncharacterized protein n=1 Tax=Datura stramonium TaxID=4076 RepID=A0ABS8TCN1_DATST|nr:hypothetical protein [Datura stramonium]
MIYRHGNSAKEGRSTELLDEYLGDSYSTPKWKDLSIGLLCVQQCQKIVSYRLRQRQALGKEIGEDYTKESMMGIKRKEFSGEFPHSNYQEEFASGVCAV